MAASTTSNAPNPKPQPLSYAERARRAASSATQASGIRIRPAALNGTVPRPVVEEATSPASSSRNLTPSSSAALTLPGSPPPSSSQTSVDEQQSSSSTMNKSPSKAPSTNVWATRKEQMARAAGQQQQGHASGPETSTQPHPLDNSNSQSRSTSNGVRTTPLHDDLHPSASEKVGDDPFVVRMPPPHVQSRRIAASTSASPPSLDDAESWPEMGRVVASSASTGSIGGISSVADSDRKEGTSGMLKKSEKTKWIPIPQKELQETYDALAAQSAANSRAQSQQRRSQQTKSRSRQQSQARPSHTQGPGFPAGNNGMGGPRSTFGSDASGRQTRAASTTHSRTTSVHSSPRLQTRGRRLPDEQTPIAVASSSATRRFPNGSTADSSHAVQGAGEANMSARGFHDSNFPLGQPGRHSGPHSQSSTPFSSHSPIYYPMPSMQPGMQNYGYGMIHPNGFYPPSSGSSPAHGGQTLPQGYAGYPPYALPPQMQPGQPHVHYMYPPMPFQFYTSPNDAQPQERLQEANNYSEPPESTETNVSSSSVPPPSALTRPRPPQDSAAVSGYRNISVVSVGPLVTASEENQESTASTKGNATEGGDMLFGSVGEPGGLKSPSPVPSLVLTPEQRERKAPSSFAIGYDGAAAVRMRIASSSKDSTDGITEAIKVIDLTDKSSRLEFGTSTTPGADESPDTNVGGATGALQLEASEERAQSPHLEAPQIVHPQPHHMLQYPSPMPPPQQMGGYAMAPPMQMMPMQSHSPQGPFQPPPHHIPSLAPLPLNPGFVSPLALSSPGPGPMAPAGGMGDEWEVRDFGYGFGAMGGVYMPERMREERMDRERDSQLKDFSNGFGGARGRRNSSASAYGAYFDGGRGGARRGRGGPNGFGRGFGGRGGYSGRGGHGSLPRHHQSLSVATGPFQQPNVHQQPQISPEVPNGYYAPPPSSTTPYFQSYSHYNALPPQQPQIQSQTPTHTHAPHNQHPKPAPITVLSFPLDPIRHQLLGQVEYYFSVQNLASDFFLRKQMDSKGWLPVPLIASFNRVKQLTQDPQLVREVVELSSLVEIRNDHVRLNNGQWASFVLPGARPSTVEGDDEGEGEIPQPSVSQSTGGNGDEEDEEDDVVFVLGGEESKPWKGSA